MQKQIRLATAFTPLIGWLDRPSSTSNAFFWILHRFAARPLLCDILSTMSNTRRQGAGSNSARSFLGTLFLGSWETKTFLIDPNVNSPFLKADITTAAGGGGN